MSDINFGDVANVLDAVANYVDGIEHEKTAAVTAARCQRIEKIAANYETATGESIPTETKDKLASVELDVLDHLLKVANNTGDSPDSLGGPADLSNSKQPTTVKEAADQAEDKFLNWIVS